MKLCRPKIHISLLTLTAVLCTSSSTRGNGVVWCLWEHYSFSLDATSASIPPGWVVLRGDGSPGTDADWRRLMQDVETIGFELGKPGFAYPALNGWDLGIDNVCISQDVPEPGPGMMFPFTVLLLILL